MPGHVKGLIIFFFFYYSFRSYLVVHVDQKTSESLTFSCFYVLLFNSGIFLVFYLFICFSYLCRGYSRQNEQFKQKEREEKENKFKVNERKQTKVKEVSHLQQKEDGGKW